MNKMKESEEMVAIEHTASDISKNQKSVQKHKEAVNPAEIVLGKYFSLSLFLPCTMFIYTQYFL